MVLIQKLDAALEADIARLVSLIVSVQETDGYIKAHQKARSPRRARAGWKVSGLSGRRLDHAATTINRGSSAAGPYTPAKDVCRSRPGPDGSAAWRRPAIHLWTTGAINR
jgi:hypothetical protein